MKKEVKNYENRTIGINVIVSENEKKNYKEMLKRVNYLYQVI